jgi:hypothetical protein
MNLLKLLGDEAVQLFLKERFVICEEFELISFKTEEKMTFEQLKITERLLTEQSATDPPIYCNLLMPR